MNKGLFKKAGNILFYVVIILVVALFIKRKFIVPKVGIEELLITDFQSNNLISLEDYKGKVVVVNFWQTWCGPCIQEMPSLNDMNLNWEDLIVFCVTDEPINKVASYFAKYPNINFVFTSNVGVYGINQFPTTYIYNKTGAKVFSKIGAKNWADPNFIATLKKNWN
jgi:thiol-disulfide isomerase/thioredoxin